jgi:carbon monoxide dehydrogenase subunit G
MRIEASRVVAASPEAVFGFLSDLENHWKLTGRWVEAVSIDDGSGRVRIHGPLGLRRTARTTVVDAHPSHVMHGTAELSGGTLARVAWELGEDAGGTAVRLSAEVEHATLPDRLLLTLGGRPWMHRRFEAILARLDSELS